MGRDLTRRALLRGGSIKLAGAAALGGAGASLIQASAADAAAPSRRDTGARNVLLIVADRMRADFVGAYGGDYDNSSPAKTPNLDAFANRSLRYKHAVPESMPAIPMRNSLLTGMRSYPFRNWQAARGVPAIPGWNGVYDFQPLMPELLHQNGIETIYVTDNPMLSGPRSRPWVRNTRVLPTSASHQTTVRSYFTPLQRDTTTDMGTTRVEPAARVLRQGLSELDKLRNKQPFFLALDAFDPDEVFAEPTSYVSGPLAAREDFTDAIPEDHVYGQLVQINADDATRQEVRSRYAAEVNSVDMAIGRVLNKLSDLGLADNTMVWVLGDCGIALGEQGEFGYPTRIVHRRVFEVPYMVRDPFGQKNGDESNWYASSHDIPSTVLSYFGVTIPGRMAGEDLTVMFRGDDEDHVPSRPYFTTALDTQYYVGDQTYLLRGSVVRSHRRLYYTKHHDKPDEIEDKTVKRPEVVESLWRVVLDSAGGTLPDFSATAARRPNPERQDDAVPQDGTLTNRDELDAQRLSQTGGG